MSEKILQQGAEATIILTDNDQIIKRRVKKSYRLPSIDESIRKQRTRAEAKLLEKVGKIVSAPKVIKVDEKTKEITMDFINGKKLSDNLDSFPIDEQKEICEIVGKEVATLHDSDIIHGDLTTSNMILSNDKVYFIDFGLGFHSHKTEDKAVDLHLLKQALEAKHFQHWRILFTEVLKGYEHSKEHKKVLEQLKKVEARGRYKGRY